MNTFRTGLATCGACVLLLAAACGGNPTTKEASTSTGPGGTATAPSGQAAKNQKDALVRFVNGVPGEDLSLSFGGANVFTNVASGDATPYKDVPADQKGFGLFTGTAGGNAPPVASDGSGVDAGQHYTVAAGLDENGKVKLDVINDNLSEPSNGKAKVRVINASADEVDVLAPTKMKGAHAGSAGNKADKWFSGVSQASAKDYKEVDPLNGTIDIERASSGGAMGGSSATGSEGPKHVSPIVQIPADFTAGKQYTILAMGGTAKHPLKASVIEDQLTGATPQNQ